MDKLTNVLVATDFSPGAQAALAQGARIAAKAGATLHLLHVVGSDTADALRALSPEGASAVDGHLRDDAIRGLRESVAKAGVSPEPEYLTAVGSAIREIVAALEQTGSELLVIGATGDNHKRMGTVAGRCVRKANTRVLMIPPTMIPSGTPGSGAAPGAGSFRNIVACVDFSDRTHIVLEEAIRLARIDGGTVTGVHVYEVPWERARWSGIPGDALQMEDDLRSLLQRRFAQIVPASATATSPAVEVKFELVRGMDYGKGLVAYATEHEADVVVLGTTGRSALGYMLLGTTAEQVMRDTTCAVLAMK